MSQKTKMSVHIDNKILEILKERAIMEKRSISSMASILIESSLKKGE